MAYEIFLLRIGDKEYYRKGNIYFYRHLKNTRKSSLIYINAKDLINILIKKI